MPNFIKQNQSILIFWLLGCLNIMNQGRHPNHHVLSHEPDKIQAYPTEGVLFTCAIFSIYFIVILLFKLSAFTTKHSFISYFICTLVAIMLFLLAGLGAMHTPPYWGAFIMNTLFLVIFQFLSFFTLFKNKKRNRDNTIP